MELRHLRYFVAVAEELHFGRAARRVFISQPPLSKQIKQLEDEVGAALLSRSRRHVRLTEAGKLFLVQAKDIVAKAEAAMEVARRTGSGERGGLVVGYIAYAGIEVLPNTLTAFRHRWPDVDIGLQRLACSDQADALRAHRIDLGFLCPPVAQDGLEVEVILREAFLAALPRKHSLARHKSVRLADLVKEPFIFSRRDCAFGYRAQVAALCRKAGFELKVAKEAHEEETIFPMVASGVGISLLPASTRKLRLKGIALRDLKDCADKLELAIAWRKDDASALVKNFRTAIRERDHTAKTGKG
jgi:DNA-binding transcriptional LysR family regulator